jgi:hypothetical protein
VIELRYLPPGFTEPGFAGFDPDASRGQVHALAQDVVPARRAALCAHPRGGRAKKPRVPPASCERLF